MTFFDDDHPGVDDDAREFLAALNAAVSTRPLPVRLDDVLVQWWAMGPCLYIAVGVPALQNLTGFSWVAEDLELCFRSRSARHGRTMQGEWGDCGHPLDSIADLAPAENLIRPGSSWCRA
jgi:hypothetical protein